ncbi:MAG TPA: SIMPL domain-containing protein [Anaerolineales bacterium]|nr:SIMPL domain-containing protein [Anaerolineales bacterium]HLO33980.1 SIMPL domain-containing protein [Anaerolineales bacterium]
MFLRQDYTQEGITCLGSAVVRVAPDFASMTIEVGNADGNPKTAFSKTKETARKLNKFLQTWEKIDSRSSNISLREEQEYVNGRWKHVGYRASIQFHVVIKDITQVEEILSGAVETGVDRILSFGFGTSALKEHRALARRNAIEAAFDKARNYCKAANVELGEVIRIEDVNPDFTSPYRESHVQNQTSSTDLSESSQAIDPGSIPVNGAVQVTFKIVNKVTKEAT